MNIKFNFSKIRKIIGILNPRLPIGGLEISDLSLKFVSSDENKISSHSIELAPGVLENGKVKDGTSFKEALLALHSQIAPKAKKEVYAILNIPDINVYSQVFGLPPAAENNMEEAVRLNLQMISPSDFSSVYSDWQRVGDSNFDGRQIEILGAFVQRQIIDDFAKALKEAKFVVVATEFYSLAISRIVSAMGEISNFCLLMRLDSSGIGFSAIRKGSLYFQRFVPWPMQEEKQITFEILRDMIIREVQKVINFSSKQWPDKIEKIFLISSSLEDKITQIISENFSLAVQRLSLPAEIKDPRGLWSFNGEGLDAMDSNFLGAFGSSLRGLISRSKDIIISLASTGTEEEFRQNQIIYFSEIWRNIILTSFIFIAVVFLGLDVFMANMGVSLKSRLANFTNLPETEEVSNLQEEAAKFNAKVSVALQAKKESLRWSRFLEEIKSAAGEGIFIDRIFVQSPLEGTVLFNGRASNESAIVNFKESLEKNQYFKSINLPLASISSLSGGMLGFSVDFKTDSSLIAPVIE